MCPGASSSFTSPYWQFFPSSRFDATWGWLTMIHLLTTQFKGAPHLKYPCACVRGV